LIPVIEAFVRTVEFMDRLREEGYVRDYALIGGLALSAWAEPRNTRDVDLVVAVADGATWPGIAALVESGFWRKTVVKKGTRRTTCVPAPCLLCISRLPACASMSFLEMGIPRPVPSLFVV
jgi:hypothetical protein